jgi:hypothetical protein
MIIPSGVAGANTRLLYVGDPNLVTCDPLSTNNANCPTYLVHPTPVSAGNVTYFDVLLKNLGKQTLTSATFGIGTLIADDNDVAGPALPIGWHVTNVSSVSGVSPTCITDPVSEAPSSGLITPGSYDGVSCNFGNLTKLGSLGSAATVRVFLKAGTDLTHEASCFDNLTAKTLEPCPALVVSGKVAEAVGGNVGNNNNTFYAYGDERPGHSYWVSGPGLVAGLFPSTSDPISPTAPGAVPTSIDLRALTGDFVVSIDETQAGPTCPVTITTCNPSASTAHVNLGDEVSPYFVWTILFPVDSTFKLTNKTGFIHFFDNYDPTDSKTFETFFNATKTSCFKT